MNEPDKKFIEWVETLLDDKISATKERYGDQSTVYRINTPHGNYFLKIASNLAAEREKLDWLNGRLPVPKVIGFANIEDKDALLMSAIEGKNLAELKKGWSADKVVDSLAEVLLRFHATDAKDCPFGEHGPNKILIHGDACLPNFIFQSDVFSGYIDLGDARIDTPDADLSASVWSLQHNLGLGHGLRFLEKYGIKNATEEMVEKLRLQYEETQRKWGL